MSKQQVEIFMPPNRLKAKVGGEGGLDLGAVKRAEAAIEELKCEFSDWINDDVTNLVIARDAHKANENAGTLSNLYRAAHDLKGQATTFEFPLVSRVASSLVKLTDEDNAAPAPNALIDAHVDAIRVILRQKIMDPSDKMASVLAGELERQVTAFLQKQSRS